MVVDLLLDGGEVRGAWALSYRRDRIVRNPLPLRLPVTG